MAEVEAIESGARSSWRRIGNLYDLQVTARAVTIENIYDEACRGEASLTDFAIAARAWLTYVYT